MGVVEEHIHAFVVEFRITRIDTGQKPKYNTTKAGNA